MAWQQVRQFSTFLLKNQSQILRIRRGNLLLRINQKSNLVKTFSTTPTTPILLSKLDLHETIDKGFFDLSKDLIQKGADIHAKNSSGQ